MRKFVTAVLAAGVLSVVAAGPALAGQIVSATGKIRVNGQPVSVDQPLTLKKGDRVATEGSSIVFRSDAGDEIRVDANSSVRHEGAEGGVEYFFVESGIATGKLSDKTSLGTSAAWATAAKGTQTEVRAEASAATGATEGRFRALKEGTWLRNGNTDVWLPENHSVTLWIDPAKPGDTCFRTSQQNEGEIEAVRVVSGGNITVRIPRATSGCVMNHPGNKTKITNDITSNKQTKIQVTTDFGARGTAAIGPGTFALIDNSTGAVETFQDDYDSDVGDEQPMDYDPVEDASDASISRRSKR